MTKPKEMPWQKVHESNYESANGHVSFHVSEGHTDETIGEFYTPMSCCCKKPEHQIRNVIKNGRFITEAQAQALWEGSRVVIDFAEGEAFDDFNSTPQAEIKAAIALLKKGIGG